MPSRLLKLEAAEKRVFLVDKANLDSVVRYTALSYCWGPESAKESFRLSRQSFNTLQSGYPLQNLPKTFQHAFKIIEELGVEYLWIDRLCIIQDSAEDWRQEASQMGEVYSNAFVTVCAHGAADDSQGCFFPRTPSDVAPTELTLALHHPLDKSSYILGENYFTWIYRFDARVLRRAWVLQEQLLSRRTLYFGREQIFWECRSTTRCETYPNGVPIINAHAIMTRMLDRDKILWKTPLDIASENNIRVRLHLDTLGSCLLEWEQTVQEYNRRHLTHVNDRLVAIAGLASQMKDKLRGLGADDGYNAGIWGFSLPRGLLWQVHGTRYVELTERRAPSWSWAAVERTVLCFGYMLRSGAEECVSGVRASTTTRNDTVAGIVVEGSLSLKGRLAAPIWSRTVVRDWDGLTTPLRLLRNPGTDGHILVKDGHIIFDDPETEKSSLEIFCLPIVYDIVSLSRFKKPRQQKWAVLGIVLKKSEKGRALFYRVGYFACAVENEQSARGFFGKLSEELIEIE